MKTKITSLYDALAFQLQGLYFTETKLKEEFLSSSSVITSRKIRREIENYIASADSKMLKLERVFNYLMIEPLSRKNAAINDVINETHQILSATTSTHLRDILAIGCLQNVNAYKIAAYRSAYMFAVELELDTATDLLQQILEWEIDSSKSFSALGIEEFNSAQLPTVEV
jgi:ferritin-like metal-binding protein YciE